MLQFPINPDGERPTPFSNHQLGNRPPPLTKQILLAALGLRDVSSQQLRSAQPVLDRYVAIFNDDKGSKPYFDAVSAVAAAVVGNERRWSLLPGSHDQRVSDPTLLERVLSVSVAIAKANDADSLDPKVKIALQQVASLATWQRRSCLFLLHQLEAKLGDEVSAADALQRVLGSATLSYGARLERTGTKWVAADEKQTKKLNAEVYWYLINSVGEAPGALEILNARPPTVCTPQGDFCRVLFLRACHQSAYTTTPKPELRFLSALEKSEPEVLHGLASVLKAIGEDPAAARKYVTQLSRMPHASTADTVKLGLELVNSGVAIGHFTVELQRVFLELFQDAGDSVDAVKRLARSVSRYLERHPTFVDIVDGVVRRLGAAPGEPLKDRRICDKLAVILEAKNVRACDRISSSEFETIITDLTAQTLILRAVHEKDPEVRRRLEKALASRSGVAADNPPFSLRSTPQETKTTFMGQTRHAFRRMLDGHYGFQSQTFAMRHTPVSRRHYYDEFAHEIGADNYEVVAKDFNRFPGRGRLITGIRPERLFGIDPADQNADPFRRWKKDILHVFNPSEEARALGDVHPLDDRVENGRLDTIYLSVRGLRGAIMPSNPIAVFEGEPITYLEYNHHFDPTGPYLAIAVPTSVILSFVKPSLRPIGGDLTNDNALDITDSPPTVAQLAKRCREMRTRVGVINLGSGACYFGGFCNAFETGSMPFLEWQRRSYGTVYRDNYQVPHKWHIRDEHRQLRRLHDVHKHLYHFLVASTNRLDFLNVADALYAWGQTNGPTVASTTSGLDDDMNLDIGGEYRQQPMALSDASDFQPEFDNNLESVFNADPSWKERSMRMLEWITLQMYECKRAGIDKKDIPVLALQPTLVRGAVPNSPFIIDAATGVVWRRGAKPLLFERIDGEVPPDVRQWWLEEVAPLYLSKSWWAPRMMARDNFEKQIAAIKAENTKG